MENKIIAFVAGKSGGHILPCLYVAQQEMNELSTDEIFFFSTNLPLDKKIIKEYDIVTSHICVPLHALPSSIFYVPHFVWYVLCSFIKSFFMLSENRPLKLVTTGGIVAIPTCLAAWILRIPIEIYVLDLKPGKAIRFLFLFATRLYYCFTQTEQFLPKGKSHFKKYPLRYTTKDYQKTAEAARLTLGLSAHKKTVCILGGSQGSLSINTIVREWIEHTKDNLENVQIIHQIGQQDTHSWHVFYPHYGVQAYVFDYRKDIANMYMAADLIVARAGAGTLFEIQSFAKKALIVPLETQKNNHQLDNAYAISKQFPEQFVVVRQEDIHKNPISFFSLINNSLHISSQVHTTPQKSISL